jgi:mediator of DNA damage checkpoint protein 1
MTSNMLFSSVYYHLSKALPPRQRSQLSQVLDTNGARAVDYTDSSLTHYITNLPPVPESPDHLPQHSTAKLVTPLWVERTLVLGMVQDAAYYSPSPTMLFSGVVATSCDLSASDNEVLSAGISSLGGQWRSALTKDVTHLFALSTGSQKYETAMHFKDGTGMKIVLPHWFDDVVRLGIRSLPTDEYEWPEPKLFRAFGVPAINISTGDEIRMDKRLKSLSAERKAFYDTALLIAKDLPVRTEESRDVWQGMKIVLGSSLDLNTSQRQAHSADIMREGGLVLEFDSLEDEIAKVQEADIYITRYRSGPTFVKVRLISFFILTLLTAA